ncbi:hypothetical protein CMO93_05790 [Candidatus Woesearchaeota archaeon]|jgi:hypothetical protein|nr:hypothetical protein [Candidatus Woesearchaeota archaeon]|tara:strand:+ start:4090 stop:4254 length:165 start_codon:yes stop_codon:yes gene_type:complete
MENTIHAHELLDLIMNAETPYTMEELEKAVPDKMGKNVIKDNKISVNELEICDY